MIDNPSTIPKDLLLVLSARNFPLGNIISRFNWYPVGINSNKFSSKSSKANLEMQISEVFDSIWRRIKVSEPQTYLVGGTSHEPDLC